MIDDIQAKLRAQAGTDCQCDLAREILGPRSSFKCDLCARLEAAYTLGQSSERARQQGRISKRKRKSDEPPCALCGGPHPFDTSVVSEQWNSVVRQRGLPDFLCLSCIVIAFVKAGEPFAANVWGDFNSGVVCLSMTCTERKEGAS